MVRQLSVSGPADADSMQTICPGETTKKTRFPSTCVSGVQNSSPAVDLLMDEVRGHLCCCCPSTLAQFFLHPACKASAQNFSHEELPPELSESLQCPTPFVQQGVPILAVARGSCASPLLLQAPPARAEPLQTPVKYGANLAMRRFKEAFLWPKQLQCFAAVLQTLETKHSSF